MDSMTLIDVILVTIIVVMIIIITIDEMVISQEIRAVDTTEHGEEGMTLEVLREDEK